MKPLKNDKWLDKLISDTISTEIQPFDFDKWKQKYPEEFQKLVSPVRQDSQAPSARGQNIWTTIMKSKITKFAVAAAVIIVVMAGIYSFDGSVDIAAPAFGVQYVLEAMKKAEWVHYVVEVTELNVDAKTAEETDFGGWESWQSLHPSVCIEKHDNGKIYFTEKDEGKTSRYDPQANMITIEYRSRSTSQPDYADIADMYIKQIAEVEKKGGKVNYEEGVYEARPVKIISIDFASNGGLSTKMSIIVDPETYLPKKFTVEQNEDSKSLHVAILGIFDYPETGPADIYQAGAPQDAKVVIVDKRPDPEFLEATKPYREARENLPPQHILVTTETLGGKNIRRICVVYKDGRKERFEERMWINEPEDSLPKDETFDVILTWALSTQTDAISVHLYDGEYIYKARRNSKAVWSVGEKKYSPKFNSRSYFGDLVQRGWPRINKGTLIENNYAEENNLLCIETSNTSRIEDGKLIRAANKQLYYLDPQFDYICVRKEKFQHRIPPYDEPIDVKDLDFDPEDTPSTPSSVTTVIEIAQTDTGQWYPKKVQTDSKTWRDYGEGWESCISTSFITLFLETDPEFPEGIFDVDRFPGCSEPN